MTRNTILSLLDALAMAKIKVFHWHLTDDDAWHLPISKYPDVLSATGTSAFGASPDK